MECKNRDLSKVSMNGNQFLVKYEADYKKRCVDDILNDLDMIKVKNQMKIVQN